MKTTTMRQIVKHIQSACHLQHPREPGRGPGRSSSPRALSVPMGEVARRHKESAAWGRVAITRESSMRVAHTVSCST